jgi:predicted transcriptional regulator
MASELLNLTAQIVISHASVTELTSKELLQEIKEVYGVLTSLAKEVEVPETKTPVKRSWKPRAMKAVKMKASPEARAILDEEKAPFEDQDYVEFMADREG